MPSIDPSIIPLMAPQPLTFLLFSLLLFPSLLQSQQPYTGLGTTDCSTHDNSTSLLGYFCTAPSTPCAAYLTFHSQPPYNTIAAIAALLNADPAQISQANSLANTASTIPTGNRILVPVTCACSGSHYQHNASYAVQSGDTAFIIANNTFQGLSTCQAILDQNKMNSTSYLVVGTDITIPLRCACPSRNQSSSGINYFLSYLVGSGDTLYIISQRASVDLKSIEDANELTSTDSVYPFTTLLVPLQHQPNDSQITTPSPPPQPPSNPTPPPSKKSSSHTGVYIAIGVSVAALLLIASALVVLLLKRRKKAAHELVHANSNPSMRTSKTSVLAKEILSAISAAGSPLKMYKFEELQLATENFSSENRISGSIYRSIFDGDIAAVERIDRDVSMEIEILKQIHHSNLIRLHGVCFHNPHWYLVREFAEKGPLSSWVFDRSGSKILNWTQRLQIAADIADGLNYLHSYTQPAYVHMDIRSSSILLDANFRAKITNFGSTRPAWGGNSGDFTLTAHIVGMRGYMAPEYLEHGLVSTKVDVYAFGMVLFEMVTGRQASDLDELITMLGGGDEYGRENKIEELVDPLMNGDYPLVECTVVIELIGRCVQRDAGSRPGMGEVAQFLSRIAGGASSTGWQSSNRSHLQY